VKLFTFQYLCRKTYCKLQSGNFVVKKDRENFVLFARIMQKIVLPKV